jgi:hypothetical protein
MIYNSEAGCTGGSTGHYTQVMWASTRFVGCGYTVSGGTLCNYFPAGNYVGQVPFVLGQACSTCDGKFHCDNLLCSNATQSATSQTVGKSTVIGKLKICSVIDILRIFHKINFCYCGKIYCHR